MTQSATAPAQAAQIGSICIIDDDQVNRMLLAELIRKHSYSKNILEYANGFEAMEALKERVKQKHDLPDLILVDINMPVMNGCAFMNEFSKLNAFNRKEINIYMHTSGDAAEGQKCIADQSAITGFLSKPIDSGVLAGIMENLNRV
jgi:CheY-like chemotaxis protein